MADEEDTAFSMPRRFAVVLFVALGLASIVGSGGGGGEPASIETINGLQVPPDPGPAGVATVAGIDTDGNGIRDDVDRFIASNHGSSAAQVAATRVSAKALQAVLMADSANLEASTLAVHASMDAAVCVAKMLLTAGAAPAPALSALLAKTNNTLERMRQREAVTNRVGPVSRSATAVVCP